MWEFAIFIVNLLGNHLVMLYSKFESIKQWARSATYGKDAFKNFEILVEKIENRHLINKSQTKLKMIFKQIERRTPVGFAIGVLLVLMWIDI